MPVYVELQCVLISEGKKKCILTDDPSIPLLDFLISCGPHFLATRTATPQALSYPRNAIILKTSSDLGSDPSHLSSNPLCLFPH